MWQTPLWRKPCSVGTTRVLAVSGSGCTVAPKNLITRQGGRPNLISTTRFTLLTWLPKSLFMQFQRAANVYFLFVSTIVCFDWSPIMWQSTLIPFVCVLFWTALKDMYEDIRRRRDDDAENMRTCLRYDFAKNEFVRALWSEVLCGDILLSFADERIPADVLLIRAASGTAFISTVNLDGETNLKERRAADLLSAATELAGPDVRLPRSPLEQEVEQDRRCPTEHIKALAMQIVKLLTEQGLEAQLEEPKVGLMDMDGAVHLNTPSKVVLETLQSLGVEQPAPVNYEHFVPRGCVLRNTAYIVSMVAYVGSETKTQLNVAATDAKISNMQIYLNRGVQGLVATLIVFCLYAAVSAEATRERYWDSWPPEADSDFLWKPFLYYVIILYQIVPISLYVTFEVIKLILGIQINLDPQMVDPLTNKAAVARTADLVEELGQVDFVFSDKTGTLTENEMVFARCCISGKDMGDFRPDVKVQPNGTTSAEETAGVAEVRRILANSEDDELRAEVRWFFFCLVTCHTAQVEPGQDGRLHFSGSSPDEVAFLEGAHSIGITFESRKRQPGSSGWELQVAGPPGEGSRAFRVLCEVPFTSERKRMTVIVQYEGKYFCICKGADNVIGPLCSEPFDALSVEHLTNYSKLGLRTLAIASKIIERSFWEDWQQRLKAAQALPEGRSEAVAEVVAEMEQSLALSGISAIEDKLQLGVPEAIVTIKAAGIRFWVLTGDKTETAVEIVRASQLFTEEMTLAYMVNCIDSEHATELLKAAQGKLEGTTAGGLILDGTLVKHAMGSEAHHRLLYQLAVQSRACVCCRLSPQQKRKLVELVKEQNHSGITLAIGDGANDVSMIQGAHVGVGIRGKEGNQAVQASDVALSQFRFLVPLLLCHGRRAYRRVALYLCYYIYKHIVLATADMIWAHQDRFRGRIAYPEWLSSAFPAVLSALPIIVVVGVDSDLPDDVACRSPELYVEGLQRMYFGPRIFMGWMLSALWHGTLAWVLPNWLAVSWADDPDQLDPAEFWIGSCCSFTLVMVYINLRLWMLSLNPFAKPVVLVFLLSFVLLLITLFCLGETEMGEAMQPQIRGVPTTMFSGWKYLRVLLFSPLVLLLDFAFYQALYRLRPMPLDQARREWQRVRRNAK